MELFRQHGLTGLECRGDSRSHGTAGQGDDERVDAGELQHVRCVLEVTGNGVTRGDFAAQTVTIVGNGGDSAAVELGERVEVGYLSNESGADQADPRAALGPVTGLARHVILVNRCPGRRPGRHCRLRRAKFHLLDNPGLHSNNRGSVHCSGDGAGNMIGGVNQLPDENLQGVEIHGGGSAGSGVEARGSRDRGPESDL